ncbi:Peptidyl-prolyl cis-trans isomerase cyp10 [Ceratobasidium sp. 370]|nr:Peptidyl-prolyl cis-trans isomerase cyp10 [Ceratobasidium sp. 370]
MWLPSIIVGHAEYLVGGNQGKHIVLIIEVFCEAVPKAAEAWTPFPRPTLTPPDHPSQNFLALCASGAYDGCIFHRNIKGFMIQTGDPTGTGKGGQSIWGKPFGDEIRATLKFNARGVVAMANSGPDSNKAQFFITYAKQSHLDAKYTIFGKVIDGADTTLDAMERVVVNEKHRPLHEIKLNSVTIHANPIAAAALNA